MRTLELELWPKISRALSFILIAMIDNITQFFGCLVHQ